MYKIYKATNKQNGKVYIGQTTKTLEKRKMAHLARSKFGSHYYFHNAIRKYGIDGFEWEILYDEIENSQEADRLEIEAINRFESTINSKGYNLSTGGGGGDTFTNNPKKEEIREKLRKINTGKKRSIETKRKMSEKLLGNTHTLGRHLTEEHKNKISEHSDHHSPPIAGRKFEDFYGNERAKEIKQKISAASRGRFFSKEHRDKIGMAHKGKIVSEKTREKLRMANKGKIPAMAKLNIEIVKKLRTIIFPSKPDNKSWALFEKELGLEYNISASVIRKIRYGVLWKNI